MSQEIVIREEAISDLPFGRDDYSNVLKKSLPAKEDLDSLPPSYIEPSAGFSVETHLTSSARDPEVNRFGRLAGQGLQDWEKSGWIWKGDPRGWMQWYLRFYEGRRCEDDTRQVMRCKLQCLFRLCP